MTRASDNNDIDLMLAFDGESGDADLRAAMRDPDAAAKLRALEQVGDVVRSYVELSAEAADDRLAGLWEKIEHRINANGQAASSSAAPAELRARRERVSLFERLTRWFEEHRGHFVTGAVSAAAVALLMLVASPKQDTHTKVVTVPARPVEADPVKVQEATPPEVESMEVYQGSGTILTVPGEDGEAATSVIWLAPEDAEETMEGPI